MQVFQAHVIDSTHLELERPIPLPEGAAVVLSVNFSDTGDKEDEDYLALATESLAECYGDSEPEYSLDNYES